ncbi:MAG: epoxide hydrolase, partial [Gemmatimonadota bacterium]|nr:epoxide hydrolase [Gemmatimonadota bacterium]
MVDVSEQMLADLRDRLENTRWPRDSARGWGEGPNVDYVVELVRYWRTRFDWRAQERALNSFPQFRSTLDGRRIHFVHVRGCGPDSMPLVLTHGWPSTFFEYLKIIPLLTDPEGFGGDPADSFDVVVPSLPGYGFSDTLPVGAFNRVPELWVRLMSTLGYERFGAYGGDIGGMVTNRLALEHPERLIGISTSFLAEPYIGEGAAPLSGAEQAFLECRRQNDEVSGGYTHLGRTTPQLLSFPAGDSPAGLAAQIVHFWRLWSDCDGEIERRFTKDELLITVMLYWVSNSIASSYRPYVDWALGSTGRPSVWETRPEVSAGVDSKPLGRGETIDVPAAITLFSLARAPREWAERAYSDIQRFTDMPRGGHFGAMEEPALLA